LRLRGWTYSEHDVVEISDTVDHAGACLSDIHSVDEMKQRLIQVWSILEQDYINISGVKDLNLLFH